MNKTTQRRRWLAWEEELMRRHYPDMLTEAFAQVLRRPVKQVYAKAHDMGLTKSAEFRASGLSGRWSHENCSTGGRFVPGQTPWNKGMKGLLLSPATTFKPGVLQGRAAQLVAPLGSYRVNGDGYLDQKISDKPGPQHHRWRAVHRIVWERAHGQVPAGHAVVFRPGRRSTDPEAITLDALELVTRAQLMSRNTLHNLPPPLRQLVHLRGVLNRAINTKRKEAS